MESWICSFEVSTIQRMGISFSLGTKFVVCPTHESYENWYTANNTIFTILHFRSLCGGDGFYPFVQKYNFLACDVIIWLPGNAFSSFSTRQPNNVLWLAEPQLMCLKLQNMFYKTQRYRQIWYRYIIQLNRQKQKTSKSKYVK